MWVKGRAGVSAFRIDPARQETLTSSASSRSAACFALEGRLKPLLSWCFAGTALNFALDTENIRP